MVNDGKIQYSDGKLMKNPEIDVSQVVEYGSEGIVPL